MTILDKPKILVISDNINQGTQISSMIPLIRFDDKVSVILCTDIEDFESVCAPKIVILYVNKENIIDSLKAIKASNLLRYSKVLLLLDDNDSELLCSAYDVGIDYFLIGFDETTLFLSVLSLLKICAETLSSEQRALMRDILIDKNFLDVFMVYSYEKNCDTLNNYLKERDFDYNVLMISPSLEAEENVSANIISANLIKSIRTDDIPFHIGGKTFAILFRTVDESRIKLFYEKLKIKYESICSLYGVGAKLGNNTEFAVLYLQKMLEENKKSGQEYAYWGNLNEVKSLGNLEPENGEEEYMKSKSKFWKAFSELVTPYFFRTKTIMESRFPDSVINDSVNEEETSFSIHQGSVGANIKITYPAFSRINVLISFERNGESKSHKEFYELKNFNEQVLDELFTELFDGYEMLIHSEQNE